MAGGDDTSRGFLLLLYVLTALGSLVLGFALAWVIFRAAAVAAEEPEGLGTRLPAIEAELASLRTQQADILDRVTQWQTRTSGRMKATKYADPAAALREQYPSSTNRFIQKKLRQLAREGDGA